VTQLEGFERIAFTFPLVSLLGNTLPLEEEKERMYSNLTLAFLIV
jgi:hypothetical protein